MKFIKCALAALFLLAGAGFLFAQSGTESRWQNSIMSVLQLKLGGTLLTSSAAELNLTDNMSAAVNVGLAASVTTDGMDITLTVQDAAGSTIASTATILVWISEAATCAGLTADTYSGDVTIVSGVEVAEHTAKKAFLVQTAATGIATMLAVASANPADQYVCAQVYGDGGVSVSAVSGTNWEGA